MHACMHVCMYLCVCVDVCVCVCVSLCVREMSRLNMLDSMHLKHLHILYWQ